MDWWAIIWTWLGNGAVIGLATYFGKMHIEKIKGEVQKEAIQLKNDANLSLEQMKSTVQREVTQMNTDANRNLKELENIFDKLKSENEYFHKISLESYEELFSKKISNTEILSELLSSYEDLVLLPYTQLESKKRIQFENFLKLNEFIRKNSLYFSKTLVTTNIELFHKIKVPLEQYHLNRDIEIDDNFDSNQELAYKLKGIEIEVFEELFNEHKENITNLINLIYKEIESVTEIINRNFILEKDTQ